MPLKKILFILFIVLILFIITIIPKKCKRKDHKDIYKNNTNLLWRKYPDPFYFIDKIMYINLKHRKDRDQQLRNEIEDKTLLSKIYRLDAIKDTPGCIGCTKSHIKCLEIAIENDWKNVLILEDDAMFHKFDSGYNTLLKLIEKDPYFDVILLGGTASDFDKSTGKLHSAQTSTSYIVNNHYFNTLLENFKEGLSKLMIIKNLEKSKRYNYESKYCIDQYWKILMKIHNWYIVNPALMIQRPSESDIEDVFKDYTSFFNI